MGGRHAEGRNLLSGETIPLPNPGSFKPQIARFQESRQLEQPGYAKMQPGFMKNRCHRLTFNVGEYPVFPPPGMGRLGRPIGSPDGVREGQMKRRPVLGVRVSPTGGARQDEPASAGGMRAAGAVLGQAIGAFFRSAVICCGFVEARLSSEWDAGGAGEGRGGFWGPGFTGGRRLAGYAGVSGGRYEGCGCLARGGFSLAL